MTIEEPALTVITEQDLSKLTRGAAILGTGGGGDPHIGKLLAQAAVREHGPVRVVQLDELPDDAVVISAAMVGAPTVMVEKLPSEVQFAQAVQTLADRQGVTPSHISCIEVGGVNSTSPIVAAAELGLPLVDGDGMGRAFPEIQMVLPTLYGYSAAPMCVADEKGNSLVIDAIDNHWVERLARTATVEMGCSVSAAQFLLTGSRVKQSFVPGTLSLCVRLGAALEHARLVNADPVAAVVEILGGRVLLEAKVVDVERRTHTGFARGTARLEGTGVDAGHQAQLSFQNEHLLVEVDQRLETTTPDLIIVLEAETGEPITTEALRFGMRVRVVTAGADPRWHSREAYQLVGPRYFGYNTPPVRFDGRRVELS